MKRSKGIILIIIGSILWGATGPMMEWVLHNSELSVSFFLTVRLIVAGTSILVFLKFQKKKVTTYAAHLKGKNTYDKENYQSGTAILIGNEGNGLRDEVAEKADVWVQIPMQGKVESLNAAIAASILMFEVYRQRR